MAHERASSTLLKVVAFASRSFTGPFTVFTGLRLSLTSCSMPRTVCALVALPREGRGHARRVRHATRAARPTHALCTVLALASSARAGNFACSRCKRRRPAQVARAIEMCTSSASSRLFRDDDAGLDICLARCKTKFMFYIMDLSLQEAREEVRTIMEADPVPSTASGPRPD